MNRNRPPALTSPWKIGFLVSLLLVAMAIGVGFFVTRTFGLHWTWIEVAGTNWQQWRFHSDRFVTELFPLVLAVVLLSLVAYFTITGAVRRYRAYLDSGLDYNHLVASLSGIDDIDDAETSKALDRHPDLRDFLLRIRERVVERERVVNEKEEMLAARAEQIEGSEALAADAGVLVSAIMNGRDGFASELALAHPRMKDVEKAIREHLLAAPAAPAGAGPAAADVETAVRAAFEAARGDVHRALAALESQASTLRRQAEACEQSLGAAAGAPSPGPVLAAMDECAGTLAAVVEEARALAIRSAMTATERGDAESVEMAESLRAIAERMAQAVSAWEVASSQARTALAGESGGEGPAEAMRSLAQSISRFVASLESTARDIDARLGGVAGADADVAIEEAAPGLGDATPEAEDDASFEFQGAAPIFRETDAVESPDLVGLERDTDPVAGVMHDAATPAAPRRDATSTAAEAPAAPAASEPPAAPQASGAAPTTGAPQAAGAPEPNAVELGESVQAPEAGLSRADASPSPDDAMFEEFVTAPGPGAATGAVAGGGVGGGAAEVPGAGADPGAKAPAGAAPSDEGGDVIDLYELGAVDYEPENALHNV